MAREARRQEIAAYLEKNRVAWDWFADFPFSHDDQPACAPTDPGTQCGTPFILLKLLPRLAPEVWGEADNFLESAGLFVDERLPGWSVARGIGWTGLSRKAEMLGQVTDHATFTCGACHIGRVRLEDGGYEYIDGGINTEFDYVTYRIKVFETIASLLGEKDPAQVLGLLAEAQKGQPVEALNQAVGKVLAALEAAVAESPTFFYAGFAYGDRHFDADYEAGQVALFRQDAPAHIVKFLAFETIQYIALGSLVQANYADVSGVMLAGLPGMADANGLANALPVTLYHLDSEAFGMFKDAKLTRTPAVTDFMAVWEQGKRRARWNEDQTALVDGGGQWNGNIPIPMFRTMAAELVMGFGPNTDLRISALAEGFLEDLPAAPYPFEVDMALAQTGQALFADNCASCHRANNGEVFDLGTDMGRANNIGQDGVERGRAIFTALCSPDRVIDVPGRGPETPCAEFEGVSLAGDNARFTMTDAAATQGYQATALGGVWAQAPYLHNGSVPTLYHLLVPSERPDTFVKSRLDYDTVNVGFAWQDDPAAKEGYVFDTTAFGAFGHAGHDQDVEHEGQIRKLDWGDDRDGARAIIEYLKTF